jgi:L,D-transpeptidase-like protein
MRCKFAGFLILALVGSAGCARPRVGAGPEPEFAFPRPEEISAEAWTHATAAYQRAALRGLATGSLLTVIDYTLPSNTRRLWVVELGTAEVLMHEFVAHGSGSGGVWATSFSNRTGSKRSSVGTFITAGSYAGVRGIARRLVGLEPGINDHALQRGIVLHGTPGVSAARARLGRLGRTEGCPAVPKESARRLVNLLGEGSVVFIWYPDRALLSSSEYVDRGAATLRHAGLN